MTTLTIELDYHEDLTEEQKEIAKDENLEYVSSQIQKGMREGELSLSDGDTMIEGWWRCIEN